MPRADSAIDTAPNTTIRIPRMRMGARESETSESMVLSEKEMPGSSARPASRTAGAALWGSNEVRMAKLIQRFGERPVNHRAGSTVPPVLFYVLDHAHNGDPVRLRAGGTELDSLADS